MTALWSQSGDEMLLALTRLHERDNLKTADERAMILVIRTRKWSDIWRIPGDGNAFGTRGFELFL